MQFTLTSEEGLPIRGHLQVSQQTQALVVLIHGFKGFQDWGFFPWLGDALSSEAIAVCRFNMSRNGIGENPETFDRLDLFADDTYSAQMSDLRTVIRHCHSRADVPIFLLGHSRGGGVALLAASTIPNLRGVITWSAISHTDRWDAKVRDRWRNDGYVEVENARTKQMMRMSTRILDDIETNHFDVLAAASKLKVPLLAMHGAKDDSVPPSELEEIANAAPDVAKVLISGASHTYNAIHPLVTVPRELQLAAAITAKFVSAYA